MLDVLIYSFDNIQNHKNTALIFFDIKKAFDTVNHNILLNKTQHYGIKGTVLKLFASFLTDWHQFISINNVNSNKSLMQIGVPQEFVIGPLLFALHINNLTNCSTFKPKLFIDDTCFALLYKNLNQLNDAIYQQIKVVNNWIIANHLTLTLNKSNKICRKISSDKYDTVFTKLSTVHYAKYLGITLDYRFSFDLHINNLVKKLSRLVGILAEVKPFLDTKTMLHLYYAIFHPHLLYGILVWGSTCKSYLKKLGTQQNKAVKIIGGCRYSNRATPFYLKFGTLK